MPKSKLLKRATQWLSTLDLPKIMTAGHIEGAINMPYGNGMQENFGDLPTDTQLNHRGVLFRPDSRPDDSDPPRMLGYDAIATEVRHDAGMGTDYVTQKAATAYFADFEANPMIAPADLFAKMDADEDLFILSIRQQDVYDEGHLKGAYLASWGTDLASKVAMLPTDVPVYVYCYTGQTAGQTVALLRMLGIDAYSIQSGYNQRRDGGTEGYEAYIETDCQ